MENPLKLRLSVCVGTTMQLSRLSRHGVARLLDKYLINPRRLLKFMSSVSNVNRI